MLKSINISNYALIESISIEFDKGFSVITGETGAGKSILLGALGLILGQRADLTVLMDQEKKCIVEGLFDIQDYNLEKYMLDNDLDYDKQTIIRREILPSGKSRAFINDTPVVLTLLKDFVSKLIDIHSQHQILLLVENHFQLNVIDTVANSFDQLIKYKIVYKEYKEVKSRLKELEEKHQEQLKDVDYWTFQFNQLDEAKLVADEQLELEQRLQKLTHAEEIKSNLAKVVSIFDDESISVLNSLREAKSCLEKIVQFLDEGDDYIQRVQSAFIDLKDLSEELNYKSNDIDHSPNELEEIQGRLSLIYDLQQKHQAKTVEELIEIRADLDNKLQSVNNFEDDLKNIQKELKRVLSQLNDIAEDLSKKRQSSFKKVEEYIETHLKRLGMPSAQLKIECTTKKEFGVDGKNEIVFLFSSNKSNLAPINKVASGGEMSRLMLCIKSLIANSTQLPTLILDEIDTGVSGEIAHQMGLIMAEMGVSSQLIAITHLPQIAGKGQQHYKVFKIEDSIKTISRIEILDNNQRIEEIAKMLSGSELSDAALKNARELLQN